MRYHITLDNAYRRPKYGEVCGFNHPLYSKGTLFKIGDKGLVVIQQRCKYKHTFWTEIDSWLNDQLYLHPKFYEYFEKHSGTCKDGLYPTVTIRQIMWALRMKPLPKERWDTVFDRKDI